MTPAPSQTCCLSGVCPASGTGRQRPAAPQVRSPCRTVACSACWRTDEADDRRERFCCLRRSCERFCPLVVRISFYRTRPNKRFHAVSPCLLSFIHIISQITPIERTCGFNPVCRAMTRRHSELKSLNNERLAAVSFHAGMSYARY